MSDQFTRNLEETNVIRSEKASAMEKKYQESPDPWKNGERGLYYPMMDTVVSKIVDHLDDKPLLWTDIGCGGGNVGRAFLKSLQEHEIEVQMFGLDISPTAVDYLNKDSSSPYNYCMCVDIEKLDYDECVYYFNNRDVITFIEVMYYLGEKKPWKKTIDTIWGSLKSGTIVIVADGLISYQYREYLRSKSDAKILSEYTDMDNPVCREVSDNGREWNRYLKVRVYQKL